jgi:hypothetical protein
MDGAISIGTLSTSTGSPRLGGTASKLDTEAVLLATYEAKRLPAVRLENRTSRNEEKIAAFEELRTLLGQLQQAADGLRNPPGFLGAASNVFETKQAFFSSSSAVAPGEIAGVAVTNSAAAGAFDLTVMQLASAEKRATASTLGAAATLGDAWNGGTAFAGQPIGRGFYAVGGIGATFFSPSGPGYDSETKPSANLGFGYYWPLTENVALRAEARGFFTLVDSSGGFLCSGGCVAVIKGDLFTQYGAMLGLTARF